MSAETIISIVALVSTFVLGILQWGASSKNKRVEALSINAETITKLSRRIDELEKRDDEKQRRIDELETTVKKYARALERAMRYIKQKLPNEPIPDFLLDTGELQPKR